jgi:hypothetical protein
MTGDIVMGANKITSTATPTADSDLTRKAYVDSILGSATSAADSAAAAAISETNAAGSASAASNSATSASNSADSAAASLDSFDDRYLGSKASAPTVDNDGDPLLEGALYWNSTSDQLFIWDGAAWSTAAFDTLSPTFVDLTVTGVGQFTSTGAVKVPVGSEAQRPTPAIGQFRFNSDTGQFEGYNGSAWGSIGGGATGAGGDAVFIENDQVVTTDYTIPANKNAMSTGPITINAGATVTVSSGARYVVI